MHPVILAIFLFMLGASVGSFLNVVVWRLPRVELPPGTGLFREFWLSLRALSSPPSHCPRCNTRLSWRDNMPVLGWILLAGKCRYCKQPISPRYPIIELLTGLMFVGTYLALFHGGLGPCAPGITTVNQYGIETTIAAGLSLDRDGWLLWLYLPMLACLLAASLIDWELFIIPLWIPWLMAVLGVATHAFAGRPDLPGNVIQSAPISLMALAGTVGLIVSIVLLRVGILRQSFADGDQLTKNESDAIAAGTMRKEDLLLDAREYSKAEVRREMVHEMLFLLPPLLLAGVAGILALRMPGVGEFAQSLTTTHGVSGLLGALAGGLVGALWVWATRVLGSFAVGREAMGMGDVHLMFGVGAVLGAGMVSVAFFLAPLPGLLFHLYLIFVDPKRAVPYGPYLSFASALVIFIQCQAQQYVGGGLEGLGILIRSMVGQ